MVNIEKSEAELCVKGSNYILWIDTHKSICSIFSGNPGEKLIEFKIHSTVDTLKFKEITSQLKLKGIIEGESVEITFECDSNIWEQKVYIFECDDNSVQYYCKVKGSNDCIDNLNYFMEREYDEIGATAYFSQVYVPRFDWKIGKVYITPEDSDSLGCQQWLSPPPFCYAFKLDNKWVSCGLAVKPGEYNFMSYDYHGGSTFYLSLTYEGHTVVKGEYELPHIVFIFGESCENDAIKAYINWMNNKRYLETKEKFVHAWWREPIFCGWGQQRYDYRADHDGHENGNFKNVGDYSSQNIYSMYIDHMDQKGINPGTIIIDFNWSEKGALGKPSLKKWRNMRGFIDRQHQRGRRVLLWYTPLIAEGLPEEACMLLDGKIVAADPTSPVYKKIMYEEIEKMISSEGECLNADGFKIDFTQCLPSERGFFRNYLNSVWGLMSEDEKNIYEPLGKRENLIKTYENKWGVEILKEYLTVINERMKEIKPESVLITHTANPYFANIVDVLRLNDLDGTSRDVLGIMRNRAEIARMCSPYWLIDTDNDLMINKNMWREYIRMQPLLGIPDTYYISVIASSGEVFDQEDYDLLKSVWNEYREELYKTNCDMK